MGEFGLIDRLARMVSQEHEPKNGPWRQVLIGIGDDAAAFKENGSTQLVTTDCLIQDVHFNLNTTSFKELGWKALAINLSDIAAMGGIASYVLVSLVLPEYTEVDTITDLYAGMTELAQKYKLAIIGGNVSEGPVIMINITVLGSAPGQDGRMLTRSSARPGDRIAVTGYLGAAAAGLEMLEKSIKFDPETRAIFRQAILSPQPRLAEGRLLLQHGVKTAIDVSDGLISDLSHILKASQVAVRIEVDHIPIHPAVKANFYNRALEMALSGGEDYELLFTASAEVMAKIEAEVACHTSVIGEITSGKAGEISLLKSDGSPFKPRNTGWEHFATG